jgi:hypothetical protein
METAVMKLNNGKFLALFLLLCFYWVLPVMKETTGQSYINMI